MNSAAEMEKAIAERDTALATIEKVRQRVLNLRASEAGATGLAIDINAIIRGDR